MAVKQWYEYGITQPYSGNPRGGEMGVDIGTPFRTPITALYAGTVRWAGRTQWACGSSGGEVTIVCNVPGYGVMTSYYLHLDDATVAQGDTVHQGQVIGHSGGQLSGGHWPVVNCPQKGLMYSSGPHTEFGFNAPWVSGPGRNVNPMFAINQAIHGTLPNSSPDGTNTLPASAEQASQGGAPQVVVDPSLLEAGLLQFYNLSSQTHKTVYHINGFDGLVQALNDAEQFANWNWFNPFGSMLADMKPFFVRLFIFVIALFIILAVLGDVIKGQASTLISLAGMAAAPETGGASMAASGAANSALGASGAAAKAPTALAK